MSALMNPKAVDRLGALCGMLGSAHSGEQAAAASAATALLKRYGLTWRELVQRAFGSAEDDDPPDLRAAVRECLRSDRLSDWERNFLASIVDFDVDDLSDKQLHILDRIVRKVRR